MTNWELEKKVEKIINDNCIETMYEGTEVDRVELKNDIITLINTIKMLSPKKSL